MAKKVQQSTVELVYEALVLKGWHVDDVELDRGAITVTAMSPDGEQLIDTFKATGTRKWLDGVMDVNPVVAEPELSEEEWEALYGNVTDNDVCLAFLDEIPALVTSKEVAEAVVRVLDEILEPAAVEAAPETPKGEDEMKVYACEKCGEILPEPARFCEPHGRMELARQEEEVKAFIEHEESLLTSYLNVREDYIEEHPFLGVVFESMTFRRFLCIRYETPQSDGSTVTRDRKLLVSHVYQAKSTDGICVVGYDTYREEVRTFRIDRMRGAYLGECAPEPTHGKPVLYPASYDLRKAVPQVMRNPEKYIGKGWSTKPLPVVLMQ